MFHTFLIKYAEIGLKGKNRYVFEDALVSHIHHSLKRLDGKFTVTKRQGVSMRPQRKNLITMRSSTH